jgi:hypothetical protein
VLASVSTIKSLERALAEAFPVWQWLIKNTDDYWYSAAASIVAADGSLVAADAKPWLKEQIALAGSERLIHQIKNDDLRFARTGGDTTFYAIGSDPTDTLDFVQIHVWPTSRMVYLLRDIRPWQLENSPDNWGNDFDLVEQSTPVYACGPRDIVSSSDWLARCRISCREDRKKAVARMEKVAVTQIFADGRSQTAIPYLEYEPLPSGWIEQPGREERFFNDWKASSAGSYPMGRFWFLRTSDYVHDDGRHHVGFIPQAVVWPRATIRVRDRSRLTLIERIARFDRKVGHPFAWFFYMVHGNRIIDTVGSEIAAGVRKGNIRLDPRDEAVLMAWAKDPYSF